MRSLRRMVLLGTGLVAGITAVLAFPVRFGGMSADLPEGWKVVSQEEGSFAASAEGPGIGVFQAAILPLGSYADTAALLGAVRSSLGAQGETAMFSLDGREGALAEIRFRVGSAAMQGYLLCLEASAGQVALVAYADSATYPERIDFLLSALDSFRVSAEEQDRPGPISQFLSPYPSEATHTGRVTFGGVAVPVAYAPGELEAMQALIEREARILARYAAHPSRDDAWRRYYRMIYRDSRPRLEPLARALSGLAEGGTTDEAQAVLAWLQGFGYERTGSLSDLLSPLETVIRGVGDCDARALAMVLILSHLDTDGVILVSSVYSHAVAAVAVDAPGLGLMVDGRKYVLAETTGHMPLGWLAEDQRDLANWVVVRFHG